MLKNDVLPFCREICDNNSLIEMPDISDVMERLYTEYELLRKEYREQIFEKEDDTCLLDRHKVSSCVCGAFLKVGFFDRRRIFDRIQKEKKAIAVYFFYVNEIVALYAATTFLSYFMIEDYCDNPDRVRRISESFPIMPTVTHSKKGYWNSFLFNLSHADCKNYDMYAYAMVYFMLEQYFYNANGWLSKEENETFI